MANGTTKFGQARSQLDTFIYLQTLGGTENGDLITTTSVNYTYDNYGNALTIDTTVTDNDPGSPYVNDSWTTNITNTPQVDTTHGCLGLLTQTQVAYSACVGGSVTRTKTFTPDTTHCRYTQIVTEPNSASYMVTEALTFDSFGNIATDTITGANMPSSPASRVTTNNWGTTGQFLTTQTDPSGAATTWTYNSAQSQDPSQSGCYSLCLSSQGNSTVGLPATPGMQGDPNVPASLSIVDSQDMGYYTNYTYQLNNL